MGLTDAPVIAVTNLPLVVQQMAPDSEDDGAIFMTIDTSPQYTDPPAPPNPLEARLEELRAQAKIYAKAQADRIYLEHFRKSKLSMLMKQVAKEQKIEAVNAQEREARCHPDYLQVLDALREATEIAEREGWLLRIAMRGSSLYQTMEATKRAEISAYNARGS